MDETAVEEAMNWCRRSGKWAPGTHKNFQEFVRMLQEVAVDPRDLNLGREIGKGTFGSINRATLNGRKVAVKFVGKEASSGPKALPQVMHELMLELQVVKTLDHPSICGFVGASARFPRSNQAHRDWSIGLIFELCEEGDLHKRVIVDRAHFSIREKLKILTGVASGIAYLHSRPIVHRDLSSRNLLMTSSGHVKICDFGCARLMKEFCYRPSFISGSPPWMAPEQILGKPITLTVDVYAFGAILWELFTGKVPFQNRLNTNGVEALQNTCRSERGLPPMSDMQLGNLDPELKSSLNRLLAVSHHPNPVLRPDAQRVRLIMLSISDTYDRPPRSEFDAKQHSKVLQEIEFRAELGKRMSMFERKYAPGVVKNLENLHKLIEKHALDLDAYNEALRNRHKADLNSLPGLKPLVSPFAKTNQSHKPDDGTSRRLLSGSRRPPLPTEDQEPMLQKQTLKALRSANPSSSSASSGDTATFNGHNGHNDNMEPAAARYVNIMDPVTSKIVAWQEFKDAASGGTYYYNTMTQGTQWKPPPGWPTVDPQFAGKGKTTGEARSILMADTSPSLRSAQSPFIGPSNPTKLMADTSPSLRSAQSPFVGPSNPTKLMADTSPSLRSAQSPFFGPSNPTKEAESVPKQSPSLGPSDVPLPAGWVVNQCAKTGRTYYSGQNSKRLQWNPPTDPDVPGARLASGGMNVHQDAEARLIAERQKEMENRLRAFYAIWNVTNKDKDVPQIVSQYVRSPSDLDSILRERFYGTDLTWGLSDLKSHVQMEKLKAQAAPDAANENYGSLKLSSDGRSSIVC